MRRAQTILMSVLMITTVFAGCIGWEKMEKKEKMYESADLVLLNGKIWTADDTQPYAEAIAIKGDRIIGVGNMEEIKNYIANYTKVIDLKGNRVVPGFQDSHTHFLATAAIANRSTGNPFEPQYEEHDERKAYVTRFAIGTTHVATKALNSTPMDMPAIPPTPPPEYMLDGIRFGMDEILKMGITTVFEAGADIEHYEALKMMEEKGELKIRFELYFASRNTDEVIERGFKCGDGGDWVRVLGVKFYADGWLGPRTCALREKYNDTIYPWQAVYDKGILFMEQEKANNDVLKAHKAGLKIAAHTIGDRAVEVMLNAYENALRQYPVDNHRYTLEHAQVLSPDLIKRIKELKVIPSIQLSFATSDMHFAEAALGPERVKWAYPWKTLLDEGIRCAGGSDFSVETISPLWGIQRIVTRQELNGEPEGGWHPEQRLTVEEALRLITIDSAYNSFEEKIKGSIETGKLADIVVLSQDILEIPPNKISETKVEMTIVGGKIMYVSPESGLYPVCMG